MHCTSHLRHWQWTCLWSDVKFWTLLKHVALWHLHWFYNLNIVILYVNVDWKMGDTSSHLVLWCERCISHLIHCNCSCSWHDINFGKMTQTYYVLTFAFAFMMQTLWNRLYTFIFKMGSHLHKWCCDVWTAFHNWNIWIWHVCVWRKIASMWLKHIVFWHLNTNSRC